jgi:hypothetical protein
MKLMKNYKPVPSEAAEEFYPNGIFVFNISKLIQYIHLNPDIFKAETVAVNAVNSFNSFKSSNLNESTVKSADISIPLIMAEISPDQFNLIDGHHRLERAKREGREVISVYKIPAEHHVLFLNASEVYQAYVEYWNEKCKEIGKVNAI